MGPMLSSMLIAVVCGAVFMVIYGACAFRWRPDTALGVALSFFIGTVAGTVLVTPAIIIALTGGLSLSADWQILLVLTSFGVGGVMTGCAWGAVFLRCCRKAFPDGGPKESGGATTDGGGES